MPIGLIKLSAKFAHGLAAKGRSPQYFVLVNHEFCASQPQSGDGYGDQGTRMEIAAMLMVSH
jgi:hypothetical protein